MLPYAPLGLVTCLLTLCTAIRVDWNTNKGPIVPPTPRTTVRPSLPYRAPAPVWEDQSNDIPNPNPFIYVLPPPSRPRPATNNYLTSDRRPVTQANYNNFVNYSHYGNLLAPSAVNALAHNGNAASNGGSLAAQYVPNVGIKYVAVVPKYYQKPTKYAPNNGGYYPANNNNNKFHGKYNAKTKKYKAYEKVKFAPLNYFYAPTVAPQYRPDADAADFLRIQQLPLPQAPQPFRPPQQQTQTNSNFAPVQVQAPNKWNDKWSSPAPPNAIFNARKS